MEKACFLNLGIEFSSYCGLDSYYEYGGARVPKLQKLIFQLQISSRCFSDRDTYRLSPGVVGGT